MNRTSAAFKAWNFIAIIFFGIQSLNQENNMMWTISLDCFFGGWTTAKPTLQTNILRTCRSRHGNVHPHPAPWGIRSNPLDLSPDKNRRQNLPSCEMYIRVPFFCGWHVTSSEISCGSDLKIFTRMWFPSWQFAIQIAKSNEGCRNSSKSFGGEKRRCLKSARGFRNSSKMCLET